MGGGDLAEKGKATGSREGQWRCFVYVEVQRPAIKICMLDFISMMVVVEFIDHVDHLTWSIYFNTLDKFSCKLFNAYLIILGVTVTSRKTT